jgi:hypothetical protein
LRLVERLLNVAPQVWIQSQVGPIPEDSERTNLAPGTRELGKSFLELLRDLGRQRL